MRRRDHTPGPGQPAGHRPGLDGKKQCQNPVSSVVKEKGVSKQRCHIYVRESVIQMHSSMRELMHEGMFV